MLDVMKEGITRLQFLRTVKSFHTRVSYILVRNMGSSDFLFHENFLCCLEHWLCTNQTPSADARENKEKARGTILTDSINTVKQVSEAVLIFRR